MFGYSDETLSLVFDILHKLSEMCVDPEFTDLLLYLDKNRMSVNLFHKHLFFSFRFYSLENVC